MRVPSTDALRRFFAIHLSALLALVASVATLQRPSVASDCALTFPIGTTLNAEVIVYPNFVVPPGDPDWTHGFTTPNAWFAVKVTDPSSPIPPGTYGAYCVDETHFLPAPFSHPPGTPYTGNIFSTCDAVELAYLPNHGGLPPVGPPPVTSLETWHKVDYILNHKAGYYWWNIQVAIHRLVGGPAPNDPVLPNPDTYGYPPADATEIDAILADANAHAATWVVPCGGVTGVLFSVPDPQIQPPNDMLYQIIVLEMPLVCLTSPVSCGNVGSFYSSALNGGALTLPYSYLVVAGSLPAGLALDPVSGVISGTPTEAGIFSFSVKLTDSTAPAPQTRTLDCRITIYPAVSLSSPASGGFGGVSYASGIVPSGGSGSGFAFSIVAGALPDGLVLNGSTGLISGVPSKAGTFYFSINVADISGCGSAVLDWSITIAASALGDFIWEDVNRNGVQEIGEPGIAGALVTLTDCLGNSAVDIGGLPVAPVVTSGSGTYYFTNLKPGQYQVKVVLPIGYVFTQPFFGGNLLKDSNVSPTTGLSDCRTLAPGQVDYSVDGGAYRPATLGDFVWNDLNGNGVQDVGEPGIADVVVRLFNCTDDASTATPLSTTTTANGSGPKPLGYYQFSGLAPGCYKVAFVTPAGFAPTAAYQGGDTAKDSDAVNGVTGAVTLVAGASDQTIDAGFCQLPARCLEMAKLANKTVVAPYEPVIYTYIVHNCGSQTLNNITVTDDNGTPGQSSDDFTVGVIASLAPGATATLTATVIPVVSTVGVVNGVTVNAGAIIVVTSLANGDIKATYLQDFGINDNTYGTGAIGWPNGHKFGDLTGSDKLEFRFFAKDGSVALDFYVDTITAATSVTVPGTGQVISYPSGYGTLGAFGGDGFMVAGDKNNIVTFSTSISDNLNKSANLPNKAALIVNSPTSLVGGNVVVDPVKAPGGWDYINSYTVVVKGSTFAAGGGFSAVTVPDQHNSPNKLAGPNGMATTAVDSTVMNTATAVCGTLTATATASVSIVVNTSGGSTLPSPWMTQDIGVVNAAGSASYANGTFTVAGSGKDIDGGDDEFRYLYQAASGDCSIVAKVLTMQNTDAHATAGVMIRETLGNKSTYAGVFMTPSSGILFKQRPSTGAPVATKAVAGLVAPYWVKAVRVGNTFTAYRSLDGTTWTQIDKPVTINMGSSVFIGLGVSSHHDGVLCSATFNNVAATP